MEEFKALCGTLGVPEPSLIVEVARIVIKKISFTTEDIRNSPDLSLMLQKQILAAQVEAERTALDTSPWVVSDRSALDPIVYAHTYAGADAAKQITESGTWQAIRQRMAESVVIVCEPVVDWLQDDGVRLLPKDNEEWIQIHSRFCTLLEEEGIGYSVLGSDIRESSGRVDFVVSRWRQRLEEIALQAE
jgi:nicotinamide riboside kinase